MPLAVPRRNVPPVLPLLAVVLLLLLLLLLDPPQPAAVTTSISAPRNSGSAACHLLFILPSL